MIPDRSIAQRAMQLHEEKLRPFLLASMAYENPLAIALALQYELVSILASGAETKEEVRQAFARSFELARHQIEAFGVGRPHP